MMAERLISICIPTYNGGQTIDKTLVSIIKEVEKVENYLSEIEIVLTDDKSTDNSVSIINQFIKKYHYIKLFINDKNLGMDGNFRQSAINASGKFVWFSGQDDIFLEGSVAHVMKVIKENHDLGIIYINYSQYSQELAKTICPSMFHKQVFRPGDINFDKDLFFNNSSEYFKFFKDAPTFLPATIMKREYWFINNLDKFIGTHYIQYANVLINMMDNKICAITSPFIQGVIPKNGWHKNGNFLFSVIVGKLKAETLVFREHSGAFPKKLYYNDRRRFIYNFFKISLGIRLYGYKVLKRNLCDLIYIFGKALYFFYFLPILYISYLFPNAVLKVLKNFNDKKII